MSKHSLNHVSAIQQGRTQGVRGVELNPPTLSLIFYENFITCAKEIICFRILFAC